MKKTALLVLTCIAATASQAATETQDPLQALGFLSGDWRSTSSTSGAGDRFRADLKGHILVRSSLHDVAAGNDAAGTMSSSLTIYPDVSGKQFRAIYFDSDGRVIQYVSSAVESGKSIQFVSEVPALGPKFRLTYQLVGSKTLHAKFEMAMPNQPQEYHVIAEGDETPAP
jgi:hypothetical protein